MIFPYVTGTDAEGAGGAEGAAYGHKVLKVLAPALILFIALEFSSCAGKPPPGPKYLRPGPATGTAYTATADRAVITNKFFTVMLTPLRPGSPRTKSLSPLFAELFEKNFVIIITAIKNNSHEKLIYDPAFTMLIDSESERRTPLDYTDLYEVLTGMDKDASPERRLKEVRGEFHDRSLTLGPGAETSRLLIFLPISEKAETAVLLMDNIYIDTDTVDVSFPFDLRGAGK